MVTKDFILKLLSMIDEQLKKDQAFMKAAEDYFTDSTLISNQNNDLLNAIDYMWRTFIENGSEDSWLDWYLFEVKMFGNESKACLGGKEYNIKTDEDFADFIVDWIEYDKRLNDSNE